MKQLLVLIIPLALLAGCDVKAAATSGVAPGTTYINSFDHEGHRYVTARTLEAQGGISIIHSYACGCLGKPTSEKEK